MKFRLHSSLSLLWNSDKLFSVAKPAQKISAYISLKSFAISFGIEWPLTEFTACKQAILALACLSSRQKIFGSLLMLAKH